MRIVFGILMVGLMAGCAGPRKKGRAQHDPYEAVTIEQMKGNNVSSKVLARTILCLNARRESRPVSALTNVNVLTITNPVVVAVTNEIYSLTTNSLVTAMTNAAPPAPPAEGASGGSGAAAGDTDRPSVAPTPAAPLVSSNQAVSLAANQTVTYAPNQTAANTQVSRNLNLQVTTIADHVSISHLTNQVVSAETNHTVTYTTNYQLTTITNVVITPTNLLRHDHYLYTELIPPPEFTLHSGESLNLLIDGVPYGFMATNAAAAFVGRKGYTTTFYAVPPEVLVAIANAHEVRVRLRGINSVIEKQMSGGSRRNFRKYLLKFFQPAPAATVETKDEPPADEATPEAGHSGRS